MTEQITQEQAGQVAEWLGLDSEEDMGGQKCWLIGKTHNGYDRYKSQVGLQKYLYSSGGQSAVMDRLEALNLTVSSGRYIEGKVHVTFMKPFSSGNTCARVEADTRQHALLRAVLEMLKEK